MQVLQGVKMRWVGPNESSIFPNRLITWIYSFYHISYYSQATYPIALLEEACADVGIEVSTDTDNGFGICDVGETIIIPVRPNLSDNDKASQEKGT